MEKVIPPKYSFKDRCAISVLSVSRMLPGIYNYLRSSEDLEQWRAIARFIDDYLDSLVKKYDKDMPF